MVNENTTVGKSFKTLLWVVVSAGVMAGLSFVTNHKELFSPVWIGVANIVLVFAKNLFDGSVKNW